MFVSQTFLDVPIRNQHQMNVRITLVLLDDTIWSARVVDVT